MQQGRVLETGAHHPSKKAWESPYKNIALYLPAPFLRRRMRARNEWPTHSSALLDSMVWEREKQKESKFPYVLHVWEECQQTCASKYSQTWSRPSTSPSLNCLSKPVQSWDLFILQTHPCSLNWKSVWEIWKKRDDAAKRNWQGAREGHEDKQELHCHYNSRGCSVRACSCQNLARGLRQHSLPLDPFSLELDGLTFSMILLSTGWNQVAITQVISASNAIYH